MLGPEVYGPAVEKHYHLRSYISSGQTSPSQPSRQTPRYLRIIATPDNEKNQRLIAEQEGDVGILRWDCVEQYVGSTVDVVGTTSQSVR